MLAESVAATGHDPKHAIHLVHGPMLAPPVPLKRTRANHYGAAVQDALIIA